MSIKQQAQFAPVGPIQILNQLVDKEAFGTYHLMLAHHTAEKAEEFSRLMNKVSMSRRTFYQKKTTIIMDNSIVELGGSVDDDMIRCAVKAVAHDRIDKVEVIPVLPDVMGNSHDTLVVAKEAYQRWTSNVAPMPGASFMIVAQGDTWKAFTHLIDYIFWKRREDYERIGWVGIPRRLLQDGVVQSRSQAVDYIRMVAPHVKIHLLGFSDDILDDLYSARYGGVKGLDSAVPIRYDGLLVPTTSSQEIGPRKEDWFEKGTLDPIHLRNLENVRNWLQVP